MTTSGTASDNEWQQMTTSNKKWHWVKANDSEWYNDRIRMRVSKIEWFYVSKETKRQSGRYASWIILFNFLCKYITTIRNNRSQMFFETGVLKVCNIHRKTPVLESLFSKVASLEAYKFIVSIMYFFIFFTISFPEVIKTLLITVII